MKRMYIDDIRIPKKDFDIIIRSSKESIEYMEINGCPNYISFDHDLGGEDTVMNVIKFMIERDLDMDEKFIPKNFEFNVHSANPVGRDNIQGYLDSYLNQRSFNLS